MGVKNLMILLKKLCPQSLKELDFQSLSGKTLACDASITMYQFLFSTLYLTKKNKITQPLDKEGNSSGHIMGLIYRSLFLLESNIKPIWIFDGKAPEEKTDVLIKRMNKISSAEELMNDSLEDSDFQSALKYKVQSLRLTEEMKNDAKCVVELLGLPYILSPGEAEAQCAYVSKLNEVYGVVSEDSDCLAFGTKRLVKGLTASESPKKKLVEIDLEVILKELKIDMKTFIDLCILCGTDYNENIKFVGPSNAYKYIQKYGDIETIIKEVVEKQKSTVKRKYEIPANFDYKRVRELYVNPTIQKLEFKDIEKKEADISGLEKYLLEKKGFSINRTNNIIMRLIDLKKT